jgi:hypothetical protein
MHRTHCIGVVRADTLSRARFEQCGHESECRRVAQEQCGRDESKGVTDSGHTGRLTLVLRLDTVKRFGDLSGDVRIVVERTPFALDFKLRMAQLGRVSRTVSIP